MRQTLCLLLAALLPVVSASAETIRVSTTWLQNNTLEVGSGDFAEVYCEPDGPPVELANITWTGGRLEFEDCRIDDSGSSRQSLPLVIQTGQECELVRTTIDGSSTAISLQGGTLYTDEVTFTTPLAIEALDPASVVNISNTNFSMCNTAVVVAQANELHFDSCAFICNDLALDLQCFGSASFTDCTVQANLSGVRITGDASQVSFFGENIFAENRDFHVDNLSSYALDLGGSLLYGRGKFGGVVDTGDTQAANPDGLIKAADPGTGAEVITDGEAIDVIALTWSPSAITKNGIPCRINSYRVYRLDSWGNPRVPYGRTFIAETTECEIELDTIPANSGVYCVVAVMGEWSDE